MIFDILNASEGAVLNPAETFLNYIDGIEKISLKYAKLDADTKAVLNKIFPSLSLRIRNMMSTLIKKECRGFINEELYGTV